ncbi:MAG: hydroxymethylglutaryl-CoA lyase [Lysobacterales bacterium]|jgi:hydroxymethylglutaryl-CoA lyase
MPGRAVVNDVGPRDGLQNQPVRLAPEQRLELIRALLAAGVQHIEVGSFVSPKAVPAMVGTDRVLAGLEGASGVFSVLVPNLKGYELARDAGAKIVEMVLYATDGMAKANANMTREEACLVAEDILQRAADDGIGVVATLSVAWACPFDGPVEAATVTALASRFLQAGAHQVVLADTIGAADPQQVRSLTAMLVDEHGAERLACHFHDTRALGLANVFAALESGIRSFDASVGGLGGCPFAPGASGNVATEDVVMMLEQMGYETGIDLPRLLQASKLAASLTGNAPGGRAQAWLERHCREDDAPRAQQ